MTIPEKLFQSIEREIVTKKDRFTYLYLKNQALSVYCDFSRDQVGEENPSHAQVLAQLDYHFDGTFEYPAEELMFLVVELILSGGWHEDVEAYCREKIEAWKSRNDMRALIEEMAGEEAEIFMRDVEFLELL